jgi:Ni,Fe-hydrogenase I large subunit
VGGGVTNDATENLAARIAQYKSLIRTVGAFIAMEYVPIALTLGALYPDCDSNVGATFAGNTMKANNRGPGAGLGRFLSWGAFPSADAVGTLALPGGLKDVTTPANDFTVLNKAEVYAKFLAGGTKAVPTNLTEDIAHSRYDKSALDTTVYGANTKAYPGLVNRTMPARNKSGAYSYIKAPRWNNLACEVGPFARLAVAGIYPVNGTTLWAHPVLAAAAGIYFTSGGALDAAMIAPTIYAGLANASLAVTVTNYIHGLKGGLSTMDRLRGRALESFYLVQKMVGTLTKSADGGVLQWANDGWIDNAALLSTAAGSTCRSLPIPVGTVQNWGATEAPRGALMHQAKITGGKIVAYQCIVPTTWNGSPMDGSGVHGAIESAMIGVGADDLVPFSDVTQNFSTQAGTGTTSVVYGGVEVMRIAQSFDPCIACAIH